MLPILQGFQLNIKSRKDKELGDLTYYLSQYNPGKSNQESDYLNRNPVPEPDDENVNIDVHDEKYLLIFKNDIHYKKSKKRKKNCVSEGKMLKKDLHDTYCHLGRTQMINKKNYF